MYLFSAFQTAIAHVGQNSNIHQEAVRKRCLARVEKKKQLEEEARRRKEEAELLETREKELDEEKRVSIFPAGTQQQQTTSFLRLYNDFKLAHRR